MKKFNRLIALVVLMGICFPMISPISNVAYAIEDTENQEVSLEELEVKIKDIIKKLDDLKEESENLSKEELAEKLSKIEKEINKLEKSDSELLEKLNSKLENIQELLNKKEKEENPEEPKEETEENLAKPIATNDNIENKAGEVEVSTFEDLKKVVANPAITTIKVMKSMDFEETIVVDRAVTIKGINKDITLGIADNFKSLPYNDENNITGFNYDYHFIISGKGKLDLEDLIFTGRIIEDTGLGGIINLNILNLRSVEFNKIVNNNSAIVNSNELNIYGDTKFLNNSVEYAGGAISNASYFDTTEKLSINIYGKALFENNSAHNGGAIQSSIWEKAESELNIKENAEVDFTKNIAKKSENDSDGSSCTGGAIYNLTININDNSKVKFTENKADRGGAISSLKDINVSGNAEVEFIENIAYSGGAIHRYDELVDVADFEYGLSNLYVKDSGKVLFKGNSALLEIADEDERYLIGEGGAIHGVNIYNKDNGNIEFIENKGILGGAIYCQEELSIISDSSRGILFKDNEINESEGDEEALDIYIEGYPNIDLANVSFINKSKKYPNIFIGYLYYPGYDYESSKEKPEIALNFKDSYIDSSEGFIKIGLDIYEALMTEGAIAINMDNMKFENIKSILKEDEFHGGAIMARSISLVQELSKKEPSKKDIELANIYLNMENSSFNTENLNMIEKSEDNKLAELTTINSINNTYDIKEKLSLNPSNTDNNLIYNTIKAKNIEDFNETIFKNNLLILDENTEFAKYLGNNKNTGGSKEKILYETDKNKNIYIFNSNTEDLNNTLEKDTFEYKEVGSENNKGSLNHYRPVKDSLAMGFDKIAGIDKDAIDDDRKLVTMGSIENAEKIEEPENPAEPENPDSGGSSSSKKRRKKKEEVVIEEILLHKEYINGYPDNTVRPEGNLTREEASAILDRVTEDKPMIKRLFNYPDVENNRWSYNNIENLSNKGGIKGYPDGEFKPVNKITRAEAATILVRLENATSNNKNIPEEIKDHWAKKELITAIEKGWIKGYEDGSIKADNFITRAEFVTLVNRMQNRKVKAENILENIKHFNDLDKNAWYYEDIVEAANTHNYEKERLEDGSEKWTSIIK